MVKNVKRAAKKPAKKAAGPKLKFGSPEWRKKYLKGKKVVKKGKKK